MDLFMQQAEWDKDFEDRLMKLIHDEDKADWRVMTMACCDNLQILKESLNVMHDMSQMMTTYYREKV